MLKNQINLTKLFKETLEKFGLNKKPNKKKVIVFGLVGGISATCITLIQDSEGLRTTAYPDPATNGAPYTICYGHTEGVVPGMTVTQEKCNEFLLQDLRHAQEVIYNTVEVPLTEGEYNAYVSFIFNVGSGNWFNSTLLKLLNQGKRMEACQQLPRWIYANKRVMNGLKKRRYDELKECTSFGNTVFNPNIKMEE